MRLVLGEKLIAESFARRIHDDCNPVGLLLAQNAVKHAQHTEHCAGVGAIAGRQRRQRMKRTIQVRRAVNQQQARTTDEGSC